MSRVIRSSGLDTLANTTIATVLDPDLAFGVVEVPEGLALNLGNLTNELGFDDIHTTMNEKWRAAGYPGEISRFRYSYTNRGPAPSHIDHRSRSIIGSPERLAVLSVAEPGSAVVDVYGMQFESVLSPHSEPGNFAANLQRMRRSAKLLRFSEMLTRVRVGENEILVIPTLPRPTAHALTTPHGHRAGRIFDCLLTGLH